MESIVKNLQLYKLHIHHPAPSIEDIPLAIAKAVDQVMQGESFKALAPGARIAITAGSRGINQYPVLLKAIIQTLQSKGYQPFLFAAMGSHGRGVAEGQREVLTSLQITSESMDCPISCSSEVIQVDQLEAFGRTIPVYCAQEAMEADGVLVVNRIKLHTSFRGPYESGLLKMMTVGMGRAKGATMFHSLGAGLLAEAIPLIGGKILEHAPIVGGIGIVENAQEETAIIEGIPKEQIFEREKALLVEAKQLMPKLPVDQADVCIVGEMGKNFSGTGMDTNIIGRMRIHGIAEPVSPSFTYLGVLRLSEPSHGNATGIGLADFTTDKLAQSIDRRSTYLNCLTSGFVVRAAIPMSFASDRELLQGALQALKLEQIDSLRLIAIKNTLHIDEVWVTKAIYEELQDQAHIERIGESAPIPFDEHGDWVWDS